jgi:hypothetical protein
VSNQESDPFFFSIEIKDTRPVPHYDPAGQRHEFCRDDEDIARRTGNSKALCDEIYQNNSAQLYEPVAISTQCNDIYEQNANEVNDSQSTTEGFRLSSGYDCPSRRHNVTNLKTAEGLVNPVRGVEEAGDLEIIAALAELSVLSPTPIVLAAEFQLRSALAARGVVS